MSRAFVREPDGDTPEEPPPEIPLPPPPNPVTPRGLALIEAAIAEREARLAAGEAEPARLRRELRYWQARRETAQVTTPPADAGEIGFGSRVTLDWPGRGRVVLQLVGEDESEPAGGRIGWRAPVASALAGNGAGDVVTVAIGGRDLALRVLEVDNGGG